MADIRQAQDQIIRNFQRLEDPFDQYTYLLSLSTTSFRLISAYTLHSPGL